MGKQTRKERKAEEARIIAEMQSATQPLTQEKAEEKTEQIEKIYCKRCKALLEKGVCPVCGYKVYTPMEEGKRKRIRIIVASVCLVIFAVLFLLWRT